MKNRRLIKLKLLLLTGVKGVRNFLELIAGFSDPEVHNGSKRKYGEYYQIFKTNTLGKT